MAIIIACLFGFNNIAFGLAPSSRFKPLVRVVKHDNETYEIVTDEGEKRFWDEETVRSVQEGETLGKSFRNRVSFMYISSLIGQYLHLGISRHTLIPEIKRLVDTAEIAATKIDDPLLAGLEIDGLSYHEEENAFYLPIYREGIRSLYYKYYIDDSKDAPDMTIAVGENEQVYVKIEPVLKMELSGSVPRIISDLRELRHDLRNLLTPFTASKGERKIYNCLTPGIIRLMDFAAEIDQALNVLPVDTEDEIVLHAYLKSLKELSEKAQTYFAEDYLKPILEDAFQQIKIPEDQDMDLEEEREFFVNNPICYLNLTRNILGEYFVEYQRKISTVKLNTLLNSTLIANTTVKPRAKKDYAAGDISIQTDEVALCRALINIVINAGEAIVRNEFEGDFRISTKLTDDEQSVQIILSDTAGGIPPDVLPRIFDKFFSTRLPKEGGEKRGMGLAIAKEKIQDRCGGTIDVESEFGKGTTFTITLPLSGPEVKPEKPEKEGEPDSRIIAESKKDETAAKTIPESEQIRAVLFQDTIKLIQEREEKRPLIVALGTNWIKGYEKGRYLQYDALNPLITSIRAFCNKRGIIFIDEDDKDLISAIETAKGDNKNAKVIVLASADTVRSDAFEPLRDNKNAFLAGVNNQKLTTDSYIRLMEMMTLALKLAFDQEVEFDNPNIIIKKDDKFSNLFIFIPAAEPMDYELLREVYRVQTFA